MKDEEEHIGAFKGILLGAAVGIAFYLAVVFLFTF